MAVLSTNNRNSAENKALPPRNMTGSEVSYGRMLMLLNVYHEGTEGASLKWRRVRDEFVSYAKSAKNK